MAFHAGRQDVSVIEEEVWVLAASSAVQKVDAGVEIPCVCTEALTVVLYLKREMQGQGLQCKRALEYRLVLSYLCASSSACTQEHKQKGHDLFSEFVRCYMRASP